MVLRHFDIFPHVTSLKEVLAALEAAMVVLAVLVIDLWAYT